MPHPDSARRHPALPIVLATLVQFVPVTGRVAQAEVIPFSSDRWIIEGAETELVTRAGQQALRLLDGSATLRDAVPEDGIMEFDMLVRNERGFSGAFWRQREGNNAEQFYLRPHQSGHPDANQYQPLFNGASGWQLYHGEGYGAPVTYRFDDWMHVKIAFQGRRAAFFIDSEQPAFTTDRLKHEPTGGGVGVYASNFAPAWFANFEVSELPAGFSIEVPAADADLPADLVPAWDISGAFDWEALGQQAELPASLPGPLEWTRMEAEPDGLLNIARIRTLESGANAVFARLVIESDGVRSVPLVFGYSDVARVYLNRRLQYSGQNIYQSRDYRYLGTIGFFDTVWLDLQAGRNELLLAVGENFGGWGLKGRLATDAGWRIVD